MGLRHVEDLESTIELEGFDSFGSLHLKEGGLENKYLMVNWNIGNVCTYKCSYCSKDCHSGDFGWPNVEHAINIVEKIDQIYKAPPYNKAKIAFELLGGEVTIWPDIERVIQKINELGNSVRLVTNGVRKTSWWQENGSLFDGGITLSFHPEFANYKHVTEVSNVLKSVGRSPAILVLMYPEKWDYCIEAFEYLKHNADYLCLTTQRLNVLNDSESGGELLLNNSNCEDWPYTEQQEQWIRDNYGVFKDLEGQPFSYSIMGFYHSKFPDMIVETPSPYVYSHNLNSWKDWDCYIGIDTLYLQQNGAIRTNAMCQPKAVLGNWKRPKGELDNIQWPTNPIKCPYNSCYCAHDFLARKVRR